MSTYANLHSTEAPLLNMAVKSLDTAVPEASCTSRRPKHLSQSFRCSPTPALSQFELSFYTWQLKKYLNIHLSMYSVMHLMIRKVLGIER